MATGGSLDIYLLHSELFLSVASDFNQSIKVILLNRRCLVLPVIFILLDQKAKSRARYTFVVGCFFFFSFLQHAEVQGLGVKLDLHLRPLRPHQIFNQNTFS